MDVGQIILKRPWIFDIDVYIYGCLNMWLFEHEGKLLPSKPKNNFVEKKHVAVKQIKISVIVAKEIDYEMTKTHHLCYCSRSF